MKTQYIKPKVEVFTLRPLNLLFEVSEAEAGLRDVNWFDGDWIESEDEELTS